MIQIKSNRWKFINIPAYYDWKEQTVKLYRFHPQAQ